MPKKMIRCDQENIEVKFRRVMATHGKEMEALVQKAADAIHEAVKLSKEHGIPLRVSELAPGPVHFPLSAKTLWKDLDPALFEELTQFAITDLEYLEGDGWDNSYC